MGPFQYRDSQLCCEDVSLRALAAVTGTPTYVYSKAALLESLGAYSRAFHDVPHVVCYSVKANSNVGVLSVLAKAGAGADIVSGGELYRALRAGMPPKKIIFSGVGKSREEMRDALKADILMFNVESRSELRVLDEVAREMGVRAPVALRVNPDVDPQTHPYIATGLKTSKFGIPYDEALEAYEEAAKLGGLEVIGTDMHIGSQLTKATPVADAVARVVALVKALRERRIEIRTIDIGGGLGIRYRDEHPVRVSEYAEMVRSLFEGRDERLLFEPGRRLVGAAGVLLTRVEFLKPGDTRSFAIVDAAMNDLLRPSLYDAWHPVDAVRPRAGRVQEWEIVGPICESGDFLAHGRHLALAPGDLLAIGAAGAYGHVMSSNYNSRPRACEVIVDDSRTHLVRRREDVADLMRDESLLP